MSNTWRVWPNFNVAGKRDPGDPQFFKGRFPCSLAKCHSGYRYILVGDAAGLVRAFKGKGVTSAALTGIRAAKVILNYRISEACFSYCYDKANQEILRDFPYCRLLRFLTISISHLRILAPVLQAPRQSDSFHDALLDTVTAHDTYRNTLLNILKPDSIATMLSELVKSYLGLPFQVKHVPEVTYLEKTSK